MNCKNCKWWEKFQTDGGNKRNCHRYPPRGIKKVFGDYIPDWPLTSTHNFCGEFKPK